MKTSAKLLLAGLTLIACREAAAQPFKCTDAAGKITYSSMSCRDLGLKDAGEVQDRVQVSPALKTSPRPPASVREETVAKPAATQAAETPPERRCFTTRNAKGATVTRCNDKPDEE